MARAALLLFALLPAFGVGCATIRVTDPPRTATEQYLIAEAAAQAVGQINTTPLRDRLVFVDTTNFLPAGGQIDLVDGRNQLILLDRQFLLGELRSHLLLNGVRLAGDPGEADIVMEIRSPGIGIDRSDYLLGLPAMLVPAGGLEVSSVEGGTLVTPEIAFLKNIRQQGYAGVAYVAYWRESGEVVAASGPFTGQTYRVDWWYFGVGPRTAGDITPTKSGQ